MNQQSFADFQAAHQARMADLANKRDGRVAAGESIIASAKEDFRAESQKAERAHDDATHERLVSFQRHAAEVFDPLVKVYVADPNRQAVAALADALIAVEGEAWRQCGLGQPGSPPQ